MEGKADPEISIVSYQAEEEGEAAYPSRYGDQPQQWGCVKSSSHVVVMERGRSGHAEQMARSREQVSSVRGSFRCEGGKEERERRKKVNISASRSMRGCPRGDTAVTSLVE
jgi:hypothetical protein